MTSQRLVRRLLVSGLAATGVLACLPWQPALAADQLEPLRKRVADYWKARSESDLAAAYEFYSPAFRRKYSRGRFLSSFQRLLRFPPQRFSVSEVVPGPDGTTALVRVKLQIKQELAGTELEIESFSDEDWILEDGVWWKKDETVSINI